MSLRYFVLFRNGCGGKLDLHSQRNTEVVQALMLTGTGLTSGEVGRTVIIRALQIFWELNWACISCEHYHTSQLKLSLLYIQNKSVDHIFFKLPIEAFLTKAYPRRRPITLDLSIVWECRYNRRISPPGTVDRLH